MDAEIGVGCGIVASLGFEMLKVLWRREEKVSWLELFEEREPKDKDLKKLEVHFGRAQVSQYHDMF